MSLNKLQVGAIIVTLIIGVLIFFAPHQGKPEPVEVANAPLTPDQQIDSAIALVNGAAPMKGIMMLRSIAENDPENVRVQFELGKFSVQSQQLDKARDRFLKVLELDPGYTEVLPYLAQVSLLASDTAAAIGYFERYKASLTDEVVIREVQTYIDELKEI